MRWPWSKPEKRAAGDYTDTISRLLESQAVGTVANASTTAAVEAAAGALSRALASAEVVGASWVQDAVTPLVLSQVGRDLVRAGASLHAIRMGGRGDPVLVPCATWYWEGSHRRDAWTVRATADGPTSTITWTLPASSVVFAIWGASPGRPYMGAAPTAWASTTARLGAEVEKSLADEAGGPLAQLLAIPASPAPDDTEDADDPLSSLRASIKSARGKALLLETMNAGWGDGATAAPQRDWKAARLGPAPPEALVKVADAAFMRVLAACGISSALFDDSDGTAKREALRQWHLGTVRPLARLLETELSLKLETRVRLRFDNYPLDLAGRAQAFGRLVTGEVDKERALRIVGLNG